MPSKTITTTAEEVFPRNVSRKSFVVLNEDTTESIYIKRERAETPSVSATDHDYKIEPGCLLALNSLNDGLQAIQDRYTAVATSGTPRIAYFETEDVQR